MSTDRALRLIDQMLDALARERELLIGGRFRELERAATDRDEQNGRLVAIIGALGESERKRVEPLLRQLRIEALRNGELLGAALQGAAAGKRRLLEIMEAHRQLRGYDASGAPVSHTGPTGPGRRA
jgi:hypothetical protein